MWHVVPDNIKVKNTDPRIRLPRPASVRGGVDYLASLCLSLLNCKVE